MREFGHRLQRARVDAGLSQEDVAYRAGVSRYTYQKWERGFSKPGSPANPSLRNVLAMAQVLEIEPSLLLPDQTPDLTVR